MKRLSFAAALTVLLAFSPMAFAQYNGGEPVSPGYGESSGEPNPSMEGEEGSGQSQEGAEPDQQETSPSDSGEMQESPSDEGNADQDNPDQSNADSDNPDSGSQDSGDSAQPRE